MKQNTKFHITFLVPRKIPVIIFIHPHIHGCKEVMNMKEDTILKVLPWDVRSIIQKEKLEFEYLQEIRLREGKPLIFLYHDTEVIPGAKARRPYLVTKDNIREMLEYISNYSLYACEQEMRQGFITIEGGTQSGIIGTGYYGKWKGKEPEIHFFGEYPCGIRDNRMRRCGISLYCMQPGVVSYINRITAGMWKDHDVKRFDPSDIGRKFLDSGACGRSGG